MKKFEIINNKWVRVFKHDGEVTNIKLESITEISFTKMEDTWDNLAYHIALRFDGHLILIYYSQSEYAESQKDLTFLEKLLF
jgi:hypothetical protein